MTHPVEGLKPGPLAGQDLSLLTENSTLFHRRFGFAKWCPTEEEPVLTGPWSYLGEQDAEGWIAWTGGENPVPGMRVDVRWSEGDEDSSIKSDRWEWGHYAGSLNIIAFRLVAPAETAGEVSRDRPAKEPGGMECQSCWTIFIGEPFHDLCGRCAATPTPSQIRDQGALQAQAPSVTTEGTQAVVLDLLAEMTREAETVMRYLSEDGPGIVSHLLDTDDNPGQRLREAIERAKGLLP